MTTGKTIALTRRTFVGKVMSLLFNMLSMEGMMLKLKLQYFGYLMRRVDSLEKTLQSPLDCKEIQPVHPKGDRSWVFIGRTDVEAETPILWPPDVKT